MTNRNFCGDQIENIDFSNWYISKDTCQGLLFIVIVQMFSEVQSLSWQLFETFVIKENHGFNKSTLAIFRADKIKLLLINLILGIPIYTGIMGAIEWGGEMFYLYLLGFTMFTLIILMNLIPNVIMPMFNDYKELEDS